MGEIEGDGYDDESGDETSAETREKTASLQEGRVSLGALEKEVVSGGTQGIQGVVAEIEQTPPPEHETSTPAFWEYIQKKDYTGAVMEAFNIFARYMGGGRPGLEGFNHLKEKISALGLAAYTSEQLMEYVVSIEEKIAQAASLNKRLDLTYVISQVKDALAQKQAEDGEVLDQYGLLTRQLTVGSVLLLNKESRKGDVSAGIGSMTGDVVGDLLKGYDDDTQLDFTHSVIVTKIEGTKVYITHATMHRVGEEKGTAGVEEVELVPYLQHYASADVLVLEPPEAHKQKALAFVAQKVAADAKYDYMAAASTAFGGIHKANESYNCAELVAAGMDLEGVKDVTLPNDFLKEKLLRPAYVTTIKTV